MRQKNFNSIKVRLERFSVIKFTIQVHFNSIKVRLEQSATIFPFTLGAFQFHKGTIRTLIKSDNNCRFEFQFHKGTIRTYKKFAYEKTNIISIP